MPEILPESVWVLRVAMRLCTVPLLVTSLVKVPPAAWSMASVAAASTTTGVEAEIEPLVVPLPICNTPAATSVRPV